MGNFASAKVSDNVCHYLKLQADSVDTSCADMYSQAIQELERQTEFNTKATDAWNRVLTLNVTSRDMIENNLKEYDTQAKKVKHANMNHISFGKRKTKDETQFL